MTSVVVQGGFRGLVIIALTFVQLAIFIAIFEVPSDQLGHWTVPAFLAAGTIGGVIFETLKTAIEASAGRR